jgi:hypothetical protein
MNCELLKRGLAMAASALLLLSTGAFAAEDVTLDWIKSLRSDLKADRTVLIAQGLPLTREESDKFWPLYRSYRAEVDKINDETVKLVLEYADLYPDVPDEKAREMVDRYLKIEANLLKVRGKYLKKMQKVLPATKVFHFAQLDNRLDLGVRVGLASSIPMLASGRNK